MIRYSYKLTNEVSGNHKIYSSNTPKKKKKAEEERTKEAKNRWGKQNIQHNDRLKLNHIHTFFFF